MIVDEWLAVGTKAEPARFLVVPAWNPWHEGKGKKMLPYGTSGPGSAHMTRASLQQGRLYALLQWNRVHGAYNVCFYKPYCQLTMTAMDIAEIVRKPRWKIRPAHDVELFGRHDAEVFDE